MLSKLLESGRGVDLLVADLFSMSHADQPAFFVGDTDREMMFTRLAIAQCASRGPSNTDLLSLAIANRSGNPRGFGNPSRDGVVNNGDLVIISTRSMEHWISQWDRTQEGLSSQDRAVNQRAQNVIAYCRRSGRFAWVNCLARDTQRFLAPADRLDSHLAAKVES